MFKSTFESLPVELIADILGELDIASLITVSNLSRRLRAIASDTSLNPWRRPILRVLSNTEAEYEPAMKHLSIRQTVPRQNWVEILSLGKAEYLLFEMTLPNLKEAEWEECFRRRFLPGWVKWELKTWKAEFLKYVRRHIIAARAPYEPVRAGSSTGCGIGATPRARPKRVGQSMSPIFLYMAPASRALREKHRYIQLNRNGSANLLEASSRNYVPLTVFHEIKCVPRCVECGRCAHVFSKAAKQPSALAHGHPGTPLRPPLHPPRPTNLRAPLSQLVVEFRDVRVIALGVLSRPRSSFSVNRNARSFLHPPGMTKGVDEVASASTRSISEDSDESFPYSVVDPPLPGRTAPRRSTRFSPASPPRAQCRAYF